MDTGALKQPVKRILSIDIMRGLTLFLMLFVNDLYEPGVPHWLVHSKAATDGMGLADWVFPGFLFMVGMSIPYAVQSRQKKGESKGLIFMHMVIRTFSLLLIGVFMVNISRLNPDLAGIDRNLWAILLYIAVFLIWNTYPSTGKFFTGLKIMGILGLIALAYVFKSGTPEHVGWMEVSWWGILGLIGWGYFAAATTYLLIGKKIGLSLLVWLGFIGLNILSQMHLLEGLAILKPFIGVVLDGNVPSIVLAGLITGLWLGMPAFSYQKKLGGMLILGLCCLLFGFFLRQWFIISKIYATPSWAMICNGISLLVYSGLFYVVDIKNRVTWAYPFQLAGKNSLTTYLAPDIIYFICWGWGIPLFFYKQDVNVYLAVGGSMVWAVAMIGFASLLSKIGIRLKL